MARKKVETPPRVRQEEPTNGAPARADKSARPPARLAPRTLEAFKPLMRRTGGVGLSDPQSIMLWLAASVRAVITGELPSRDANSIGYLCNCALRGWEVQQEKDKGARLLARFRFKDEHGEMEAALAADGLAKEDVKKILDRLRGVRPVAPGDVSAPAGALPAPGETAAPDAVDSSAELSTGEAADDA